MSDLKWIRENRGVSVADMAKELNLSPDEYAAFEGGVGQSRLDRIPDGYKKALVASAADIVKGGKANG
ncbi:helix-turn-helix domain-containing protein [Thalassospiraceae bacterium SW-3-3]|nr:helix-turn-helix domain-containing protein [Thalassospiraceae bacterium SW-3-3]